MDTAEFMVLALSVGKVASLRIPGNARVNESYDRFQGIVATKIGEDAGRLLLEALTGEPDVDIEWLRRFIEMTGVADEPLIYTAALNAVGAMLVWIAENFPDVVSNGIAGRYQLRREDNQYSLIGGRQTLKLDPSGHFSIHDPGAGTLSTRLVALSPNSLDDLGAILRAALTDSLFPGEPAA
jgi:hypothetical protein